MTVPASMTEGLLRSFGFLQVGDVVAQRMQFRPDTKAICGKGGGVYVFVNPDGSIWKVGMTRNGYRRVTSYSGVLDGSGMKKPGEQAKLKALRTELHDGATMWVLRTADDPTLLEDLLTVVLNPTESNRRGSPRERALRSLKPTVKAPSVGARTNVDVGTGGHTTEDGKLLHRNILIAQLRAAGYPGSVSIPMPALRTLHAEWMAATAGG